MRRSLLQLNRRRSPTFRSCVLRSAEQKRCAIHSSHIPWKYKERCGVVRTVMPSAMMRCLIVVRNVAVFILHLHLPSSMILLRHDALYKHTGSRNKRPSSWAVFLFLLFLLLRKSLEFVRVVVEAGFYRASLWYGLWSQIIHSPPLVNFRDPGSAFLPLKKYASARQKTKPCNAGCTV